MNSNIIGFAGRLRSGKTELATICERYGYERLYFAKPLKMLVANLIGGTIEDVNELKNGREGYAWQKEIGAVDCMFISQQTDIPVKIVQEKLLNHIFSNTRDMLQVIGTDLIREYNNNWHVERIKSMIEEGKKYVIDDVRFTNEVKCIEDLGGIVWFVTRPKFDEISHHSSEETLKIGDFGPDVIVNDLSLEFLKFTWDLFMKHGYARSFELREEQLNKLADDKEFRDTYIKSTDPFNPLRILQIHKDLFTHSDLYLNNANSIASVSVYEDKKLRVAWKDIALDDNIVSNNIEMEELKIYL